MHKTSFPSPATLHEDFCTQLEYALCTALRSSPHEELRVLWCDGVSPLPFSYEQESGHTTSIITQAWLGKDGQDVYTMTILLGKKAAEHYARGAEFFSCIPPPIPADWFEIDTQKKTILVYLL